MTLNCIWWWGSCSGDQWSTPSLSLLLGSLRSGVVVLVRVPSMCQIDMFNSNLYLIGLCAKNKKKTKKKLLRKNYTKNVQWMWFTNLWAWNNPRLIDVPFSSNIIYIYIYIYNKRHNIYISQWQLHLFSYVLFKYINCIFSRKHEKEVL